MLFRYIKLIAAIILSLIFTISLVRLVLSIWNQLNAKAHWNRGGWNEVELWLEQNQLDEYKDLFRDKGRREDFRWMR